MDLAGLAARPLEMGFDRKHVEQKFGGREGMINGHLAKLLAFDAPEATRVVWTKEVRNHLSYRAKIRIKGHGTLPERFLRRWLYADPFEDNGAGYASAFVEMHAEEDRRNAASTTDVAERVRLFRDAAAPRLAASDAPRELVEAL